MESQHMAGVIGEPVEPSPSYRPCPRALLGRPLAFPFSQSKAAMSCQRGLVRWRASMAAAYHCHPFYHENPTLHIGVN